MISPISNHLDTKFQEMNATLVASLGPRNAAQQYVCSAKMAWHNSQFCSQTFSLQITFVFRGGMYA